MQNSQFSGRLFRPYFVVLAVVITIAMLTIAYAYIEHSKSNAYDTAHRFAEKTASQADSSIEELNGLADQVKKCGDVMNTFYELRDDKNPENYFDTNVLESIDISTDLKNLLVDKTNGCNIIIYNGTGDVISSHEYTVNANAGSISSGRFAEMYSEIISGGDDYIVKFPKQNMWTKSSDSYITLAKLLKNDYSDDVCGIVEVRGSLNDFIERVTAGMESDTAFAVRDRNTGETIDLRPSSDGSAGEAFTFPLSAANWEFEIYYRNPVNNTFLIQLAVILFGIYIILLFIAFRLTRIIAHRVSEPLIKLTDRVREINVPNAGENLVDNTAIDEIQDLENGFSQMLERMNYLSEQERESYSLALQAQMNPHFLYNTLTVIGAAGDEGGCEAVTDMCERLSNMLRYVTAYQKTTVTLREELEHTGNYLALMKSRYEDNFSYTVDADESLYDMSVPKLIIQPLVENCFKHGFKRKEPPWFVSITMHSTGSGWRLEISDNGTGIAEDRIRYIIDKTETSLKEKSFEAAAGLGIANTIIRLKMTHNDKISYEIFNNNGMTIRIISGNGEANV